MAMPYYEDQIVHPTAGPLDLELDETGTFIYIDWPTFKADRSMGELVVRMLLPVTSLEPIIGALQAFVDEARKLGTLPPKGPTQ